MAQIISNGHIRIALDVILHYFLLCLSYSQCHETLLLYRKCGMHGDEIGNPCVKSFYLTLTNACENLQTHTEKHSHRQ